MRCAAITAGLYLCFCINPGCLDKKASAPPPPAPVVEAAPNAGPAVPAPAVDPGPVGAGRKVYGANGCGRCHSVDGPGAVPGKGKGPDLSHVGSKRPADWIAEHIRDPKAHAAQSRMPRYPESKISQTDLKVLADYLASLK
jgi:mono/diheme cytochrome c family protein